MAPSSSPASLQDSEPPEHPWHPPRPRGAGGPTPTGGPIRRPKPSLASLASPGMCVNDVICIFGGFIDRAKKEKRKKKKEKKQERRETSLALTIRWPPRFTTITVLFFLLLFLLLFLSIILIDYSPAAVTSPASRRKRPISSSTVAEPWLIITNFFLLNFQ